MDVEGVIADLEATFGFKPEEIIKTSGKTGAGVIELLNRIIEVFPSPRPSPDDNLKALIYDSFYHEHKGVVALVKIVTGQVKLGDIITMLGTGAEVEPIEIGYLTPDLHKTDSLSTGEIGYIATGLKNIRLVHAGDTVTLKKYKDEGIIIKQLPGYSPPKPMVFASLYPIEADDFPEFQEALEKLALNDPAITFQKETSQALGSGFSCGFLGLLHMEITQERLEREFDTDLITTIPSVEYKLRLTTKDFSKIENINIANMDAEGFLHIKTAAEFPDQTFVVEVQEPWVNLEIITPERFIGAAMDLAQKHRAIHKSMDYMGTGRVNERHVIIKYEIPTAEIITNFFDTLKSISQGYASMDYNFLDYRKADVVKVNILINGEAVEALSFVTHRERAEHRGREAVSKLKELIPRQNFKVPVQASIGSKVIARETIQAYRKDVTAKLYGGDITRKKKLLEKQKKGKKRMKMVGSVEIPKEVFIKALRID